MIISNFSYAEITTTIISLKGLRQLQPEISKDMINK